MASPSDSTAPIFDNTQPSLDTVEPYLRKALSSYRATGAAVGLVKPVLVPDLGGTWPKIRLGRTNRILLFPGSFNPPHQGHLATIRYFFERRDTLGIVAMFIFADPEEIIRTKEKKWGKIVLPQELRNNMFAQVPKLSEFMAGGWLHLLSGDMESHIQLLRIMMDLISDARFEVKLVGLLGGDKLSFESPPHLPPGDLPAWGPVDEFLIVNARRPVDFYDASQDTTIRPHNLPGCTEWERAVHKDDLEAEQEQDSGRLWICKALTVPGEPQIQFRASQTSASNGISSTRIRRIMVEAPDENLYDLLKNEVLSVEVMIEWLQQSRSQKIRPEGLL